MILSTVIHRSSDPTALVLWCVIGFCAGVGLFIQGFRLLLRRRLILDTPFSKIRSAPMGMVEINGLAVGPYTMVAPITARACYYYRTLVWECKQKGRNKSWVKVAGECMHVPFFVDDNTGRLLVDPRGADLDLHRDFVQEFCNSFFTTKDPAPPNVTAFLARHGIVTSNKIKVEEYCVKPKNALFILGTLAENPGLEVTPEPVVNDEPVRSSSSSGLSISINSFSFNLGSRGNSEEAFQQRFASRFNVPPQKTLRAPGITVGTTTLQGQQVTDALMKAGISNSAAWAAAAAVGTSAKGAQVIVDPSAPVSVDGSNGSSHDPGASANGFDAHPPVVLMRGTNNTTFLISWRSQREVARTLGWKSTLMIWGGPVLALVSLYIFLGIEKLF
ncbi:MAG: hypothetical protein ACLQBK_16790 [Candidatus Sulfotelmatobacter sp.]